MDELRFVRREDQALVLANETGIEYRLVVDELVLAELRHLNRRERDTPRVSPREIQSLIRAGKSRAEIAEITGAADADIERYEEPVLAERRFILASAQAVPVRTTPAEGSEQQFGEVIAARLVGLAAEDVEWRSWRDEESGWMIGLDFTSHDVAHAAVWSFEHRKAVLAPVTPDAVSLSKQGEVGDRLIPKLRAVEVAGPRERFDSGAFDPESLTHDLSDTDSTDELDAAADERTGQPGLEAAIASKHPSTGAIPIIDPNAEFVRRREIDQRAIKTTDAGLPDLGQTADLLDALRKRRGEREYSPQPQQLPVTPFPGETSMDPATPVPGDDSQRPGAEMPLLVSDTAEIPEAPTPQSGERAKRGKGRAAIPSWDDILFGTRSDEDPA